MDALLYSGAAFGAALGVSILPFRKRHEAEKWLMGVLLIFGALAVASITFQHELGTFDRGGLLEIFEIGTGFAVGPLLYGLCVRRSERVQRHALPSGLHFVPAVIVSVMILVQGRFTLPILTMVLHQVAYTTATARVALLEIRRHSRDAWSIRLVGVAVAIHVAQFCRMTFRDDPSFRNVVPFTIVGGLAIVAFLAIRELLQRSLAQAARARYERSGLDEREAGRLKTRLETLMSDSKPWRDPALSLDRLAAVVGTTPHHLSELLNVYMGTSFNELVAERRLEESKRILADPANDRFTIEALAESAGFPSRSSFYSAFRRAYGETPTRFRKRIRAEVG